MAIDGIAHEIVGVMPPSYLAPPPIVFRGLLPAERAELWLPLAIDLAGGQRGAHNLTVVARLRPGVTVAAADADLKRIAIEVGQEHPDYREWSARVGAARRMGDVELAPFDDAAGGGRWLRVAAGVRKCR